MIAGAKVPSPIPVIVPNGPVVIGRLVAIPGILTVSPGVYPIPGFCGVIFVRTT